MNENIIESLIASGQPHRQTRDLLLGYPKFNKRILDYQDVALYIWQNVHTRLAAKERAYGIPYQLTETPRLYAIDALIVAEPLLKDSRQLHALAEVFTVFYLMVHFFDDHVEHRDKFYSKFSFDGLENSYTQRGAAPFSFLLIAFAVIGDILDEQAGLGTDKKLVLTSKLRDVLAEQTRYFTQERKSDLSVDEILDVKQRKVAGCALGVLADIIGCFAPDVYPLDKLRSGLIYVGSMTQITDDVRDLQIDITLANANIVVAARKARNQLLTDIFEHEAKNAIRELGDIYTKQQIELLLSLPFYPFLVDKEKLRLGKI